MTVFDFEAYYPLKVAISRNFYDNRSFLVYINIHVQSFAIHRQEFLLILSARFCFEKSLLVAYNNFEIY